MRKLRFLYLCTLCGYLVVLASLFRIQFLSHKENFAAEADYLRRDTLIPRRGMIYDVRGHVLAGSSITYDVHIDPGMLTLDESRLAHISRIISEDVASLSARLARGGSRWAPVSHEVPSTQAALLKEMNLQGMYFSQRLKRQYPEASLAASILGFVGRNEKNEYVGYYGVEGYYEEELRGLAGIYTGERDLRSHPLFFGFQDRLDRQDGRDLYLTVDAGAQRIVKQKAIEGMRRFGAKEVCIIVAEPHSMAIIALSCLPDYDPNSYKRFLSSHYRNAAIHDVYEPGSTFKPLIVAAALEQGVVNPADLLQENGPVVVGDSQISTWDNQYRGQISVADALAQSSNVGMVRIGEKMGRDAVYAAIKKFGFGEKTGIDLQGEVGGTVRPQDRWYPIDYATVTFGQGIGVTPIQLLSSFASIINGGELLRPYVVAKIGEGEMTQTKNTRMVIRRVISPATSRTMRTLLEYTVANAEYKWKLPPGYRFGGKTGTAQIAIGGRYDVSKTIASFVGFTPVDNPRFVALVILKEPTTSSWGSETAAPLFFDMAKELLTYYNVAPEY